jgi:hypothetical protein
MIRKHPGSNEPTGINPDVLDYASVLSRAFNYYNQDKDKKDARLYLKVYVKHSNPSFNIKVLDSVPDNKISTTMGWVARIITNGNTLTDKHVGDLDSYLNYLTTLKQEAPVIIKEKPARPSIQDHMQEKISETIADLEGAIDDFVTKGIIFDLYSYLKGNSTPRTFCTPIEEWTKKKAREFINVHQANDSETKEAYSHISKRQLTLLIKMLSQFLQDTEKFSQYKKANRKPRVTKVKPPIVQVAKLKFKREDTELKLKSVNPTEIVGATQVWVYNTKYKKLAAYRSDSPQGIQVKGTALQNYQPEMCEQKTLRKPEATIKALLGASKVQLRKLISDLTTKASVVSGRLNEDCIIVRVVR